MDSKSVLARFEAERQALALMDHPNIAKVLDGGVVSPGADAPGLAGRPFFVMEYVKGVPITDYCDATRLTVQRLIDLYVAWNKPDEAARWQKELQAHQKPPPRP
jgi:serine/threonine protein kinase